MTITYPPHRQSSPRSCTPPSSRAGGRPQP